MRKNYHRISKRVVAKKLGRPICAIYARAKKLGIQYKIGPREYQRGPLVKVKE